ncbi:MULTISPECIES: hypothetical protein [unclassified Rhizobium]|uniref:hypothetical protein n=1 Tax=unclassified Rhizobium TaxID=2613769 RepID=UPI001FDABB7F|nr:MULTISPECIES: hypothetical protein [unclassified Rhizobium]
MTLGKGGGGKANCILHFDDVVLYSEALIGILVPDMPHDTFAVQLRKMAEIFGDRAHVSLCLASSRPEAAALVVSNLAAQHRVRRWSPMTCWFTSPAGGSCRMSSPAFATTIDDVGFEHEWHADRFLKPSEEMSRLFPRYPEALARTMEIVERCRFSLEELVY